ncbi:hypothetical protein MacB4_01205 [Methylacidimicrobium sp. B4]|nr:hypothetical protein [Methylacidimicrobium sp. B4]QSR84924.1 hypothetical protein MacB4_01205 [Methylacidimicrobium sp. B4]
MLSEAEFLATAANPFPDAEDEAEGKELHLFFLEATPASIDAKRSNTLQSTTESWRQVGRVFSLDAPGGFDALKLAAGAERILGVPATGRNWRTVSQIRGLARGLSEPIRIPHPGGCGEKVNSRRIPRCVPHFLLLPS